MIWKIDGLTIGSVLDQVMDLVRVRCEPTPQNRWQAIDVSKRPDMRLWEVENVLLHAFWMPRTQEDAAKYIRCNMPWAEDHFQERVSGQPLNPGEQYKNWPHWHGQDDTMKDGDQFSHTYMERYWPRGAGRWKREREGIRYRYGDFHDVMALLERDPYTRQAYVPIFFPEDTGAHHGQRVPCTLGYHFKRSRNRVQECDELDIYYTIRSCDYFRHFHDDVYLTVRLAQWMLAWLTEHAAGWEDVKLGHFTMHIYSLHYFEGDRYIHKEFFDGKS